jgi:CMP-N-acetylneuraminic acid synthetase
LFRSKTFLALIPARSGSVRLPRKNLRDLNGRPLIAWSIEAALKSKYIDRVVVSTDDSEIAETSKRFGADVPFLRPPELATKDAKSIDVVIHALRHLESQLETFDYLILLQPTSPMRTAGHVDCKRIR